MSMGWGMAHMQPYDITGSCARAFSCCSSRSDETYAHRRHDMRAECRRCLFETTLWVKSTPWPRQ
jgi:hypothetical protein